MTGIDVLVQARVPNDVAAALDAIAAEAQAATAFGGRVSRSDVVRRLLADAVATHTARTADASPARARSRTR